MTTRRRRFGTPLLAIGALALFVVGPFATAVGAQEVPTPTLTSATPTLTSASVAPGGAVDVSGGGCIAGAAVRVRLDGALLVTTRSPATGGYTAHLVIPVTVTSGPHRITVVCKGTSGPLTESTNVTVELPRTGASTGMQAALGVAILMLGSLLLISTGRRRRELTPGPVPTRLRS
jgi:LPXTG-motif cell wall-anchored protein